MSLFDQWTSGRMDAGREVTFGSKMNKWPEAGRQAGRQAPFVVQIQNLLFPAMKVHMVKFATRFSQYLKYKFPLMLQGWFFSYKPRRPDGFLQIIITVLVTSFRFIWIHIFFLLFQYVDGLQTSESDVYRRQIQTSQVDPRVERVKLMSRLHPTATSLTSFPGNSSSN